MSKATLSGWTVEVLSGYPCLLVPVPTAPTDGYATARRAGLWRRKSDGRTGDLWLLDAPPEAQGVMTPAGRVLRAPSARVVMAGGFFLLPGDAHAARDFDRTVALTVLEGREDGWVTVLRAARGEVAHDLPSVPPLPSVDSRAPGVREAVRALCGGVPVEEIEDPTQRFRAGVPS